MWMRSCHIIAEGVIKMINAALAGKDAMRNAALDALTSCRDNTTLFSTVEPDPPHPLYQWRPFSASGSVLSTCTVSSGGDGIG